MEYQNYLTSEDISERIWRQLKRHHWTVAVFAEKLGVSYPSAQNYVNGTSNMNLPTFIHMCELFKVSPNYMIYGRE